MENSNNDTLGTLGNFYDTRNKFETIYETTVTQTKDKIEYIYGGIYVCITHNNTVYARRRLTLVQYIFFFFLGNSQVTVACYRWKYITSVQSSKIYMDNVEVLFGKEKHGTFTRVNFRFNRRTNIYRFDYTRHISVIISFYNKLYLYCTNRSLR